MSEQRLQAQMMFRSTTPRRTSWLLVLLYPLLFQAADGAHGPSTSIRLPAEGHTPFEPNCSNLLVRLLACEEGEAEWHTKLKGSDKATTALCWAGEGGLLVRREPWDVSQLSRGKAVFRVRAVGPQIMQTPMQRCGHGLYLAHIQLSLPGEYSFEILRLFRFFSFSDLKSEQNATVTATFKWKSKQDSQSASAPRQLSDAACLQFPVQGHWLSSKPTDPRITGLRSTYTGVVFPPPSPLATSYDDAVLQWRPLDCQMQRWEEMHAKGCLKDRHVCFVGDSHMRTLHNGFVSTLPSVLAGRPQPTSGPDVPPTKVSKTVKSSDLASYYWDVWGNMTTGRTLQHCTEVVMNFGQWPLSYQSGSAPWSLQAYHSAVTDRAQLLQQVQQQGKGVLWMTTHAYPWRETNTGPAPTDWRMLPWVQLYNSVAAQVMADHGVGVFDVSDMTAALVDLTIDGSHYHSNGTVGHAMNQYLLNYVCHLASGGRSRRKWW